MTLVEILTNSGPVGAIGMAVVAYLLRQLDRANTKVDEANARALASEAARLADHIAMRTEVVGLLREQTERERAIGETGAGMRDDVAQLRDVVEDFGDQLRESRESRDLRGPQGRAKRYDTPAPTADTSSGRQRVKP